MQRYNFSLLQKSYQQQRLLQKARLVKEIIKNNLLV